MFGQIVSVGLIAAGTIIGFTVSNPTVQAATDVVTDVVPGPFDDAGQNGGRAIRNLDEIADAAGDSGRYVDDASQAIDDARDGIRAGDSSVADIRNAINNADMPPVKGSSFVNDEVMEAHEAAAQAAIKNGDDTYSICNTNNCNWSLNNRTDHWSLGHKPTSDEIKEMFDRQGGLSPTGEKLVLSDPDKGVVGNVSVDHIVPRSCGGMDDMTNYVLVTKQENSIKGSYSDCTKIPVGIMIK